QVVRFDDHAHFVAAFLGDLMAGQAWSRWVYDEFVPLRGLPVGQIAAHLLAPRPALLIEVAQRLARESRLEALLQHLEVADVRLIWEQGFGFGTLPDGPVRGPVLDRILEALTGGVALEHGEGALARNALRLYLSAVIAQPGLAKNATTGAVCRHLALVHQMWAARPTLWLWDALARQEIVSPAPLAPVLDSLPPALTEARDWLTVILAQPSGRAYLARLVPVIVPEVSVAGEPTSDAGTAPKGTARQAATNFAGLALLLPVICDLELHAHLNREGLYQLLLAAVGRGYQPLAWSDAGPAWLAGLTAREAESARDASIIWPDVAMWDVPDAGEADLRHLGSPPCAAFALLVLRRFAQGLRGFAESSPAYLAKQFINLPGRVAVDSERVEVRFSHAPLGIVLQMAGQDGDRGPIPWLDGRHLWIHLDG
ncbi:MAG: hypothetical protein MUP61_08075, partial [Burkholderiales bacterium]|nr:hypothetical protein [Burkholderiales bacterium]